MRAGKIWRIVFDIKIKKHNKIKILLRFKLSIIHTIIRFVNLLKFKHISLIDCI